MKSITGKISRSVIFALLGSIGIATFSYAYVETKVSRIDPGLSQPTSTEA